MTPEQIPPPPRIKAWPWNGKRISGQWHVAGLGETTDYVRGDLFAAQAAELKRLRAERDAQASIIMDVGSSLVAAISLLERGGKAAKKAAPSDKMFDQMLRDYNISVARMRAFFDQKGGTQ